MAGLGALLGARAGRPATPVPQCIARSRARTRTGATVDPGGGRHGRAGDPRGDRARNPRTGRSRSASIATAAGSARTPSPPANRGTQYESWSLAKSVTALVFGRAMTLGPDRARRPARLADPGGRPAARRDHDARPADDDQRPALERLSRLQHLHARPPPRGAHGAGREAARDLLGVLAERPGPARRGGRSARSARTSRHLPSASSSGRSGSRADAWYWRRDGAGHTQGFFGLNMNADDFGRLGELMRRGGVWRGERLLSRRFVREAVDAGARERLLRLVDLAQRRRSRASARGSIDRPVTDERNFPALPADALPVLGPVRPVGDGLPEPGRGRRSHRRSTPAPSPATPPGRRRCTRSILNSITDDEIRFPKPDPDADNVSDEDVDRGFFEAFANPGEFLARRALRHRCRRPGPHALARR